MPSLSALKQTAFAPGLQAAEANALVAASGMRVNDDRVRGRGAGLNMSGRYELNTREVFDDGWSSLEDPPPPPPHPPGAVQDRGANREAAHGHHQEPVSRPFL